MARRAVKAAPPPAPVAGAGLATADTVAASGSQVLPPVHAEPELTPAVVSGSPLPVPGARAPALRVTVAGPRPVFACGRWFQPGPATRCPPGYFSARQVEQLNAHPDLSIAPEVAP